MGDPLGMAVSHAIASGMGGMRTAGDLVARMQMTRGMKINDAKKYVAAKLGVSVSDLCDPLKMREIREKHRIGMIQSTSGMPKGIEAKHNISKLMDIEINSLRASNRRIKGVYHDPK